MLHLVFLPVIPLHLVLLQFTPRLHVGIIVALETQKHYVIVTSSGQLGYPVVLELVLVEVDNVGADSVHEIMGMGHHN